MPEKPQPELKDIQEPEKYSDGLEIANTKELESVVAKANELAETIQKDQNITAGQVFDLEKDLGELKFDVCGEQMTLAEIREIPDFQQNYEIWKEIKRGQYHAEHNKLTYLIPSIAKILVTYYNEQDPVLIEDAEYIYPELRLEKIKSMPLETAEQLVDFEWFIFLDGDTDMPDESLQLLDSENIKLSSELQKRLQKIKS